MTPAAAPRHPAPEPPVRAGGRGARQRILDAASRLFYLRGINATGIEQLAAEAHVSKRTLYQHFSGKDELIAAYLTQMGEGQRLPIVAALARTDQTAKQRLLAMFDVPAGYRGCPYLNAAAELSDTAHPGRLVACRSKRAFIDQLVALSREAGAADPEQLGHQLAVLSDGASSQCLAIDSRAPADYARGAAEVLIDLAVASASRT